MISKVQPFELLVDYVTNHAQKGLTIPHADIENIMNVPYRKGCNCLNNQYSYQIQKANVKLTEMSLRLEPIQGFGYRIIKDKHYVDSMRKAYNMGVKSIEKAKFIADNTDVQALSKKDYTEWEDVFNKITDAQAYLSIIPSPVINKPKKTKATP